MAPEEFKRKLSAILSADVEGYSRLMGEDEDATIRTLTTYRELMSTLVQKYRGQVVASPGDNLLAEFGSVVDAVPNDARRSAFLAPRASGHLAKPVASGIPRERRRHHLGVTQRQQRDPCMALGDLKDASGRRGRAEGQPDHAHSLGPSALPIILPFLSSTNVVGNALTSNQAPTSALESKRAVNDSLYLLKNDFTCASVSCELIATITKFLSLNLRCNFCIDGISITHGGHHVAQKLRKTTLPRKSDKLTVLPKTSLS